MTPSQVSVVALVTVPVIVTLPLSGITDGLRVSMVTASGSAAAGATGRAGAGVSATVCRLARSPGSAAAGTPITVTAAATRAGSSDR